MEALILNLYFELLKTPVFTVEDVNKYYDNMDSARSAIKRLMKEGIVAKIRNNMYTCISGETGAPVALSLIHILHKISVGIYSNFSYFGHWFLQRYCIVKQRKNKTCFREEKRL